MLPTIRRNGSYSTSPAGQLALSEQHHKAIRDSVHEALESLGQQRGTRIDAKEILLRRGHSQQEALRLCTEFGRAMITACERTGRPMAPTEGGVRKYHVHSDAAFVASVYRAFQKRELYQRVCEQNDLDRSVADALRKSRGTSTRERPRKRQRSSVLVG